MSRARDLAGKHVVIGGGSSGIGLATAKACAKLGADVTIIARDTTRLEAAAETIAGARRGSGQSVRWVAADLAKEDGARDAIAQATRGGDAPIDMLMNAAGIIYPGNFESMPSEAFEACMDSWRACVWTTRAAAPGLIAGGSGHIVNVSSVAGFLGIFGYTAYSSAKYAIMGFSEALRSEMRPHGIAVSVVCPPDTDTPGLAFEKARRPPETDKLAGNIKPVTPDYVADAIIRGVMRGRYLIVPDLASRFYRVLKGNASWLFFAVTDSDVAACREERGA